MITAFIHLLLPAAALTSWAFVIHGSVQLWGLLALIGGTCLAYGGDRLRDPSPALAGSRTACALVTGTGATLLIIAAIACPSLLAPLLILIAIGLLQQYGKAIPLLSTGSVCASWFLAQSWLPTDNFPSIHPDPAMLIFTTLVLAGTILCDIKDTDQDAQGGRRSLPVLIGHRPARLLAGGMHLAILLIACECTQPALALTAVPGLALAMIWPGLLRRPLLAPICIDAGLASVMLWSLIF